MRSGSAEGIDRDLLRISIVVVMFGLFASWSSLAFKGATLLDVTEQSLELIQEAKLSFMIVLALGAVLVSFFGGYVKTRKSQIVVLGVSALLISGGMACCTADTAAVAHPFPFVNFGLALAGFGSALMTPALGRLFFDVGTKATTISMLVGYLLSAVMTSFVWDLLPLARLCVTLVMPVLQVGLMILYLLRLEDAGAASSSGRAERMAWALGKARLPLPVGLLVVVALSGFLGSFVRGSIYYSGSDYSVIAIESLLIQLIVLAVLTVFLGLFGKGYDTFSIFWPWAALPILACCIALPFVGESSPTIVSTFFTIAHNLFNVFNYTIFVDIATRYNRDAPTLFCWGRSFDSMGCVLGFVFGSVFAAVIPVSTHLWYVLSVISSYAIIVLAVLVLRNRRITDYDQGGVAAEEEADSLPEVEKTYQRLAEEYALTERETEILGQLDQGRSVPYISQQLLVSTSTVKTHVQSIYRKLDVHTRQQLLDTIRANREN